MLKVNKYNRNLAVDYAIKYALVRNNKYFDYTNIGGNCTNYISQCLFAGAPQMNFSSNGWFYISPANTSISWANVEPFYNFITTNTGIGIFAKESPLSMCEAGDVIQLKFKNKNIFSHALLVTKINAPNPKDIIVCANTRDIKNVPLSYYTYEKMRLIHILGFRTEI
ncbi:MAG: amidase [Clostridiales bacterium]|nr:amidase [Clostridiales bacterium]